MIKPKALKPGDEIRVVTPASPIRHDQAVDGIALLESQGYKITYGEHIWAADGYLAGSDEARAADFQAAFDDPNVAAVMCSRGGYGCARLIEHLDLDRIAASGKAMCGFSDVTTLHLALNRRGLVTYHTPMLITLSVEREPWVIESLLNILKGEDPIPAAATKAETLHPGTASGVITGGCMCLVCDSLSTLDPIEAEGKLLLLEDVDENPHRVDALFTHLRNVGILQNAAGIVIGEMTGTDERADEKIGAWPWRKIVEDRLKGINVPAVVNFPFGHMKTMLSIPFGVEATLDADAGTLKITESICAVSS